MRIGLKLTAAFLVIASLVAASGYIAQRSGREVNRHMERLGQSAIRPIAATTDLTIALYADQLAAHQQITVRRRIGIDGPSTAEAKDARGRSDHQPESPERDTATPRGVGDWPAADRDAAELAELADFLPPPSLEPVQQEFARYQQLRSRFHDLLDEEGDAAERFLEDQIRRHFHNELLPRLVAIREQAERESTGSIRGAERALVVADERRGLLMVATAAVAVSIGLFMSRSIGKPLRTLQRAAEDIGRGRLDTRVEVRSRDEIGMLAASLNQMAAALRDKTVSKDYVDNIIHSMREMLIVADPQQRIRLVNPAACSELGYAAADLKDRPLQDLFAADDSFAPAVFSPTEAGGEEASMQTKAGACIPVHFSAAEMQDESGRLTGIVCVALNVRRQKEAERRLLASLREKELLLKEVHHRVKNNLQVISSLLSLQAQEIREPEIIRLFEESQARVRSMALIHEHLYRSDDLAHIDFAAYVRELVEHLKHGFGSAAARVDFWLDIRPVPLPLDIAIPCGMIVNELVANSLEHAFPEGRRGEVRIAFGRENDGYCITVADNGVGMPAGLVPGDPTSIGLKVVQALTRQVHGTLEHACREGTMFTICFDYPERESMAAKES